MTGEPNRECPRFERCAVNNCPLHPRYSDLPKAPDDPETKCKLSKAKRVRIGERYAELLPYEGRTTREWGGEKGWRQAAKRTAVVETIEGGG